VNYSLVVFSWNFHLYKEFYWFLSINKYTKIPSNFRTVRQEIIWGNQHIKFKNKSLIYLNWINDGIIFINDIIDHEGKLSENFILRKLSLKIKVIITEIVCKLID
jgi:hypothetical protein